jgi:hemerythrin-like domain-containing protein
MKSTDELKREHEGVKRMLRVLGAVASKVEAGSPVPHADLDSITEFLSVFVDKCHHAKEEECLFPALEAAGIPREGGPIGVMLSEHAQGRVFIAKLKSAVAGYKSQKTDAPGNMAFAARGYIDLLTRHIEKENEVLFPMADMRLSPADDARLVAAFEVIERDRIGQGKHEEFHRMIKRMEKDYLG